jgi:uncharacterized membrane protein
MLRKLLSKRILSCLGLYFYQSFLDFNRANILEIYKTYSPLIGPQVAKFPVFFLLAFIMHRAFIHGLIVKIFTREKKILFYYMVTDLIIFGGAAIVLFIRKLFPQFNDFTEPVTFAFMNLLDTPILLLFFLPSFYLYKKMDLLTSSDTSN